MFLNLVDNNVYYSIKSSYDRRSGFLTAVKPYDVQDLEEQFKLIAAADPDAGYAKSSVYYMTYHVRPALHPVLKRQPKHVVVILMESLSAWPYNTEFPEFNRQTGAPLLALRPGGIYFRNFSPFCGGTFRSISATVYSVALAPVLPYANEMVEGYKPFDSMLSWTFERKGYETAYVSAMSLYQYGIYNLFPKQGFDRLLSEADLPDVQKHAYGLYDADMFELLLNAYLKQADHAGKRTMTLVMTVSNHPPYAVPPQLKDFSVDIPEPIMAQAFDRAGFQRRMNSYVYSVKALADYLQQAHQEPYFRDTLYLITADHAFGGQIKWKDEDFVRANKTQLLIYAPDLINPEFLGTERDVFGRHLDIMPTAYALTFNEDRMLVTWGRNIMAPMSGLGHTVNERYTCDESICLSDNNRLFRLRDNLADFDYLPASPDNARIAAQLEAFRHAFINTGTYYLFNFKAAGSR